MTDKAKILVVEDEEAILTGLMDVLVFHGFAVDSATDGIKGLEKALTGQYDLLLLDVMLPGMDGFEICNQVRQNDRELAIIMLTAKTTDEDIIQGLQLGADDYVAKPFSVAQLVLRIQAVLRRTRPCAETDSLIHLDADFVIDYSNMVAVNKEKKINFTRREMDILQYLYSHQERPVPRDELLNKIWGYAKNLDIETRTIDIHIAKLRRKIEKDPAKPGYIITVRGAGYRMLVK